MRNYNLKKANQGGRVILSSTINVSGINAMLYTSDRCQLPEVFRRGKQAIWHFGDVCVGTSAPAKIIVVVEWKFY